MADYSELIIFMMEIVGTIAFASSGAMLAVHYRWNLPRIKMKG